MKKRLRKKVSEKEIDLIQVKADLTQEVIDRYGSVLAFANSDEAKSLGIDKMVSNILTPNGRVSIVVINEILKLFGKPTIKKRTVVTRKVLYYI